METFEKVFGKKEHIKASILLTLLIIITIIILDLALSVFVPSVLDITALKIGALLATIIAVIYSALEWLEW